MELALYIHIPFCKSKCAYCDFLSSTFNDDEVDVYIDLLCKEIELYKNKGIIKTIFIGGGTPSILSCSQFEKLAKAIKDSFVLDLDEFTIECNPESITEKKLICYKNQGVNRISIGVQSLNNETLKAINRVHNDSLAIEKVKLARKYFDNVSCDLIYGLPYESDNDLIDNIKKLSSLGIKHLSLYSLMLEEKTKLYRDIEKGKYFIDDVDTIQNRFEKAVEVLKSLGFRRYEISNFCKNDNVCKHNMIYWQGKDYIGVGLSAYGTLNNVRYNNVLCIKEYKSMILNNELPILTKEVIDTKTKEIEYIMLSFRLQNGINLKDFKRIFEVYFTEKYKNSLVKAHDFIEITPENVKIKEKYLNISNSVILMFIDFE